MMTKYRYSKQDMAGYNRQDLATLGLGGKTTSSSIINRSRDLCDPRYWGKIGRIPERARVTGSVKE